MKILFDHPNPFLLAHGGFQIQIEQTQKALEGIGIWKDVATSPRDLYQEILG
jgi:hypothetical protein